MALIDIVLNNTVRSFFVHENRPFLSNLSKLCWHAVNVACSYGIFHSFGCEGSVAWREKFCFHTFISYGRSGIKFLIKEETLNWPFLN